MLRAGSRYTSYKGRQPHLCRIQRIEITRELRRAHRTFGRWGAKRLQRVGELTPLQ